MKFRTIKYVQVNGRIYRPGNTFNADETRSDIRKYLEKGLIRLETTPESPPIRTLPVTGRPEEASVKPTQEEPKDSIEITLDPLETISTVTEMEDLEPKKEEEPEKEIPEKEPLVPKEKSEETKPEKPKTTNNPRSRKKKKE